MQSLWRGKRAELATVLSAVNEERPVRVLQGLAVLAVGYLLAGVSQLWLIVAER